MNNKGKFYRISSVRNNNHFEQDFEDSEMVSEAAGYQVDFDGPGEPIQLIKIRPYGNIEVDETALDLIASCDLPVGFCCLAGKYRTGKSFLLNKILQLPNRGFRVDPSTNACTEGIWMWSKPMINQKQGNYIFFLDTQGTASLNRDSDNDAKIFTLANLISSYLLFNSVGCIDEKSISELNLITQLSKNIILQEHCDLRDNEQNLYRYMPKFCWVLRDFTLQLAGPKNQPLTPAQYLQNCLFEQNQSIKSNESTKKIRRALTKYYKNRDCVVLVRPALEEQALQNLNTLPDHELRRQFINGVNSLRNKILNNTGPKMYEEKPLYGSSITSMIESYVMSMNNGGIPNIKTAWDNINEDEGLRAYDLALDKFNDLFQQNFQEDQPKGEQIHHLLRVLSEASMQEFRHNITQPNDAYETKLKEYLSDRQSSILTINKQLICHRNIEILRESMAPILQKLESNQYVDNTEELNIDIKKATQRYNSKAKGEQKGELLGEFLADLQPIILEGQKRGGRNEQQNALKEYEKVQYQKKIKLLEQKLKSVQNQSQSQQDMAKRQIQKSRKQIKNSGKKPNKGKQGKGAGCCGKKDCNIM